MTIDLSEFQAERKRSCITKRAIQELGAAELEKFEAALLEPSITNRAIVEWLISRTSVRLSLDSLRNHRRRDCSCGS